MNQVLGTTAGNALEVREAIDFLTGAARDARLAQVTLALAAELLALGGLAPTRAAACSRRPRARTGRAPSASRHGGRPRRPEGGAAPRLRRLPRARWCIAVPAPRAGVLAAMDTRAIGLAIVALGGGRRAPATRSTRASASRSCGRWAAACSGQPLPRCMRRRVPPD